MTVAPSMTAANLEGGPFSSQYPFQPLKGLSGLALKTFFSRYASFLPSTRD